MALKTNYKEDVLAASNTKRKYNMITNDDGTVSFEDATEYQQTGDNFGAGDINTTNMAVNNITDGESTPIAKDWLFADKIYHKTNAIGEVQTETQPTGAVYSLPPNVWYNTPVTISLPAGTYIVIGTVEIANSADGVRGVRLATSSTKFFRESQHLITTGAVKHPTILQSVCAVTLDSTTVIYLQARQGSSETIAIDNSIIQAIRLS